MDRYKSALVWIDLEMTGLNPEHDTILRDSYGSNYQQSEMIAQGPSFVIHQPDELLLRWMPGTKSIILNLVW